MSITTDISSKLEFVISRLLDAPQALVWQAWTDPEILKQWAAPPGHTITHSEGELRPGGTWRSCMRSPEGVDFWLGGSYREIVPMERLVFTHAWDEDGQPGHVTLITVTLEDMGGKTLLTLKQEEFKSRESRDGHEVGWGLCLDILAGLLEKKSA